MALHGPPGVPDDEADPSLRLYARILADLGVVFETDEQSFEALQAGHDENARRIAALESTVALLESLMVGESPGGTR